MNYFLRLIAVAAIYFVAGKFGLMFAFAGKTVSLIWPPSGLALAAMLLMGRQFWPAVALGAFLVNMTTGAPFLTVCGIALGNTLEAFVGAYLLEKSGFSIRLESLHNVLRLIFLAALLSTMLGASIGVASLWLGGVIPDETTGTAWLGWWMGDAMGDLLIAPLLLTLATSRTSDWPPKRLAEFAALLLALSFAAMVAFGGWVEIGSGRPRPLPFIIFPLMVWGTVRFGMLGATVTTLMVFSFAGWGSIHQHGPFIGEISPLLRPSILWGFIAVLAGTTQILSAAYSERKRAERKAAAAESRFRGLVEQSLAGIYFIQNGRFVYANPTFSGIFGYTPHEILAMADPIPRLVVESDQTLVTENIRKRMQGEAGNIRYAFKGMRKDGRQVDVEVHGKAVEYDGRPAVAGVALDVTERNEAQQQLSYLAYYDILTTLPNRTLFMDHLDLAIAGANRHGNLMALLFLDLDHFKEINDTLGHPIGDLLLQETAGRLLGCMRDTDTVARLGGDEFAIIQTDLAGLEGAEILAQKIIEAISRPFLLDGNEVYTSTSIGVTVYPLEDVSPEQLLKNADMAMYAAKAQGRNNFQFFSPAMNVEAHKRMDLQTGLRQALEHGELMLHYQPKVNLQSGEIVGAEALLRWRHPEKGLIPPLEFIPVAEESGLIVPIGEWALKQACQQIKSWQRLGLPALRVSVNLSAVQFKRQNLVETITTALREADLEPRYLELEITESLLMQTARDTVDTLECLRCLDVLVSIDDFGTGYSSLNYLKRLPVDILKIDRSFIDEIPDDNDDIAITKAIISLSHHRNLRVIAEGVETRAQADFLRANGCDEVQGYYFSKPLPVEEFEALLRGGERFQI